MSYAKYKEKPGRKKETVVSIINCDLCIHFNIMVITSGLCLLLSSHCAGRQKPESV
jgi:hypothetical protein